MNKIPEKLREELQNDKFYDQCCLEGGGKKTENIFDPERIEWHHNLIFANRQVQERFCILPIKKKFHDKMVGEIKERCDWIMLCRATEDEIRRYSKAINYQREKERLILKYGNYIERRA